MQEISVCGGILYWTTWMAAIGLDKLLGFTVLEEEYHDTQKFVWAYPNHAVGPVEDTTHKNSCLARLLSRDTYNVTSERARVIHEAPVTLSRTTLALCFWWRSGKVSAYLKCFNNCQQQALLSLTSLTLVDAATNALVKVGTCLVLSLRESMLERVGEACVGTCLPFCPIPPFH